MRRASIRICSAAWIGLVLVAGPGAAQFEQYTPPGEFEETRETMQERLERNMQEARWRTGRFFVSPWLALRDVAFIDNVRGSAPGREESDVTATLGVGLRAYRPVGSEAIFAAHALPEYVWWQDLTERRRVNGRYGAGLFGNLGRTGIELSATRADDSRFFSRQFEVRVNTRDERAKAALEVELWGGVSVFAGAELRQLSFLDEDDPGLTTLVGLDREEEIVRAGFRVTLGAGLEVGLGVEETTVDFDRRSADRSNTGSSPIVQIDFRGDVLVVDADLALRDLEPEPRSFFKPYDETTGRVRIAFSPTGRSELQLFGDRNLVYSLVDDWVYFEDTSAGAGIRLSLGGAASIRLFAEQGTNDYTAIGTGRITRSDDFDAFGAELRWALGRFTLLLGGTTTDYQSNLPGFDRDVTVFRSGLLLGTGSGSPWG